MLPKELVNIIISYMRNPDYKLCSWVDSKKLNIKALCSNPRAEKFLRNVNQKLYNWDRIFANPGMTSLIDEKISRNEVTESNANHLASNPAFAKLIEKQFFQNPTKFLHNMDIECLFKNPELRSVIENVVAFDISTARMLLQNSEMGDIYHRYLIQCNRETHPRIYSNTHPKIVEYVLKVGSYNTANPAHIDAIKKLPRPLDFVDSSRLCANPHPDLETEIRSVIADLYHNSVKLSNLVQNQNPNLIDLIWNNQHKFTTKNFYDLSKNPIIFELDFDSNDKLIDDFFRF